MLPIGALSKRSGVLRLPLVTPEARRAHRQPYFLGKATIGGWHNADSMGYNPKTTGRQIESWAELLNKDFKGKTARPGQDKGEVGWGAPELQFANPKNPHLVLDMGGCSGSVRSFVSMSASIPTVENSLGGSIRLWTGICRNDHGNPKHFS